MPISPNQGSTGGGTAVAVTGANLTGTTAVRFASRPATGVVNVSPTQVDAVTPSGAGAAPVTATNPGGTGAVGTFYYLPPATLSSVTPPVGPTAGGDAVTLLGSGLFTATEVRFGAAAVQPTVVSDSELTVTVPVAAAAGTVAVTVLTAGGVGGGVTYTYLDSPTVTDIAPDSGPLDGDRYVVITGTAFLHTTSVTVGGTPVIAYRIASDTELQIGVPPGAPGPADVVVTTLGGTATAPGAYTYRANFAVLAGQSITNTGPSVITGDLGISPGTTISGFPPGVVNGDTHVADAAALQGQTELTTEYDNAAALTPDAGISGDIGGQTLAPGVYNAPTSIGITGTLTLDAAGDPDAVWVFQIGTTLSTASASEVLLINGASSCNVVWQVADAATLGTDSTFVGSILALTTITVTTGATVQGRTMARTGSVTLDTNSVTWTCS